MTINSINGPAWERRYSPISVSASAQANDSGGRRRPGRSVRAHRLTTKDPLNHYLTSEDRVVIRATTGVDIRADGEIEAASSMDLDAYQAVLDCAGQIAADRANGDLTGPVSAAYLAKLMHRYLERIAVARRRAQHVDLSV